MFFFKASFSRSLGVLNTSKGLFFPLPIAITSREISVAKLNNSTAATGSSPSPTVTIVLFFSASLFKARPIVASVSTFNRIKLMFLFKTLNATSAPEEGVPVASMTTSKSLSSSESRWDEIVMSLSVSYLLRAISSLSWFLSTIKTRSVSSILLI